MIRSIEEREYIDRYVEERQERIEHVESIMSDIMRMLRADRWGDR